MKSFILAAVMVALVAGDLFAQQCGSGQCGSSSGTNQCSINSRPRAAEPAAVPQAAPVSLKSVAVNEEWVAPEAEQSVFKVASYESGGRIEAKPVGGLNLFGVQVNRESDGQAILAQARAEAQQYEQRVADLDRRFVDAQARGEDNLDDLRRAVAQIRPQLSPDEAWELTKQSPSFQAEMKQLLESASPQIGRVEIVTVE